MKKSPSEYWLISASVVVTAEYHNPSILNPDFLKAKGIVPADWKTDQVVVTSQFSAIQFANGVTWTVDQSNLTVTEDCNSGFKDSYRIHDLVKHYLAKLPHVPYRSLGLNCVAASRMNSAEDWLTKRFLRDGAWLHGEGAIDTMIPKFTLQVDESATCILTFDCEELKYGDSLLVPSVIVNCNVHHQGPLDAKGLCNAIDQWPTRQQFVITALQRLLED